MSNVPNGGWGAPPAPANPGASVGWRIQHSWWLLLPILGFSCLGGFGFLYVGLRARRPGWWIAGIFYAVLGWAAFIVVGESDQESAVSDWAVGAVLAIWVGSVVHACLINSSWLRWRANHRPWYAQQAAPPPAWPGATYPPAPSGFAPTSAPPAFGAPTSAPPAFGAPVSGSPAWAPQPGAYYGAGPAAHVPPPVTGQQSSIAAPQPSSVPTAGSVGPVDVNTATYEQLVVLPNFTVERAQRVLAERQARRGFGNVEEFAAVANLAPHEFAHVRNLLVCGPPQQGPAGQWGQPPHGRVLDV